MSTLFDVEARRKLHETKAALVLFGCTIIYPGIVLYSYFIVIGVFCLDDKQFSSNYTLAVFIAYHFLMLYTVLFFLRLYPNEGVCTVDIFNRPFRQEPVRYAIFNAFLADLLNERVRQGLKYCDSCNVYKPPRAHHCRVCKRCYLKMDHHCYWINTCIGFHNYKFFIMFLFFNVIFSAYICTILLIEIFHPGIETRFLVNYIVCTAFFMMSLVFSCFLLIFHTILIYRNETTIENMALNQRIYYGYSRNNIFQEGPMTTDIECDDRKILNPYNLEPMDNVRQVLGDKVWQWFIPTFTTPGNGLHFPKNTKDTNDEII